MLSNKQVTGWGLKLALGKGGAAYATFVEILGCPAPGGVDSAIVSDAEHYWILAPFEGPVEIEHRDGLP
jgi:hypothetical protein